MFKHLCLIFLLITTHAIGQKPHWQNPEVVNVNKLPARATSISYPSKELAIAANRDASPRKKLLNGPWKFSFYEAPNQVPKDIYQPTYSDGKWKTIPVPSNWELEGYGKPWHRLTHQIWEKKGVKEPNIPTDYNPTGIYRKEIDMPKAWKDMQITLHVGAASSALTVWVNGQYVGYSEDNMLPAEFDITPFLQDKKNLVTFQVSQWCDGSYLEDQDHWRMSGITRDVFLEAAPQVQLYDFAVRTDLDENYEHAKLQIRPDIVFYEEKQTEGWKIEAALYDDQKQQVLKEPLTIDVQKVLKEHYPQIGNRPFQNLMQVDIESPKKWSAEYPNLYTLVLSLKDNKGKLVEARSTRIGFREIDISDGQFKVNGIPVLLYGVNRHDWDAKTGKAVTKEAMRRDAELMKKLNVNASRSSHYPNPPYWYELCDEYGIYVMDEANIESHGKGSLFSNIPAWHTTFLERGIRMVERDKNYPSIISWSLGNEAGFGPNHAALSAWIKEFDPTRPIHAEGAQNIYGYRWPSPEPNDRMYTDFVSRMYRPTELMVDLATKPNDNRPVIWCEYAHSQGNSTGDLETYWQAIRKYPRFVGAFVWDWRDQLITKESKDGRTLWKHGTDFGQKQADLNPVQKGLISADGQIKSGGWQARYIWQRAVFEAKDLKQGTLTISNRHFRTNLNEYDLKWEITKDGKVLESGQMPGPDILPNQKGEVKLSLPSITIEQGYRYHLNVSLVLKKDMPWATQGFSVANEQFLWHYSPSLKKPSLSQKPTVNDTGQQVEVVAGDIKATFDKQSGLLVKYAKGKTQIIKVEGKPNFWRAPTDNDGASGMRERQGIWKTNTYERLSLSDFQVMEHTTSATVVAMLGLKEGQGSVKLTYHVHGDGSLQVEYQFMPGAGLPELPRLGWQTAVDASFDQLTWFGRGPYESYTDKKTGMMVWAYSESVKGDFTYYVRPQESSNKTDVYWVELKNQQGQMLRIETMGHPLNVSAWPFTQQQIEEANRIEELAFGDKITLNIDLKQMGVGGDNTWNIDAAPHRPFRIPAQPYTYSFLIRIVNQ
ncbi:MAG: glycoside hydrolase family 2 TIM barrel-domain containing protein [Bacteroidota bacterium]